MAGGQPLAAGVGVVEEGGRRKKKKSSFILRRDSNQLQLYFGFDFFGVVCTHIPWLLYILWISLFVSYLEISKSFLQ